MARAGGIARTLILSLSIAAMASAGDDAEQRAEARRQFDAGTKAFAAKRFREAALAFEAACAYRVSGTALYTAGLAWEQAAAPDRAADDFARALDTPGFGEKESDDARRRLDELEKILGIVAVTGPARTVVALDDHSDVPVPAHLHGQPGKHVVVIRYADDKVSHQNVQLKVGQIVRLDVTPRAAPEPSASAPPPPPTTSVTPPEPPSKPMPVRKIVGIGFIGAGVAMAGAATILGIEALGSRDAFNAHPSREGFDHASSMQTMTNVGWVAAGVLAVGGIALVVWPAKKENASVQTSVGVAPAPGGLTLRGAW